MVILGAYVPVTGISLSSTCVGTYDCKESTYDQLDDSCTGKTLKPHQSCEVSGQLDVLTTTANQTTIGRQYRMDYSVNDHAESALLKEITSVALSAKVTPQIVTDLPEHIDSGKSYPVVVKYTNTGDVSASQSGQPISWQITGSIAPVNVIFNVKNGCSFDDLGAHKSCIYTGNLMINKGQTGKAVGINITDYFNGPSSPRTTASTKVKVD